MNYGVRKMKTECILEDGTIHTYVLCSEIKEDKFVDLRFMEYLGVSRIYSIGGIKQNNPEPNKHFWRKK